MAVVASRYASAVDVNAFTCGRSRVPGQRAAMVATFRSNALRSTNNDGRRCRRRRRQVEDVHGERRYARANTLTRRDSPLHSTTLKPWSSTR